MSRYHAHRDDDGCRGGAHRTPPYQRRYWPAGDDGLDQVLWNRVDASGDCWEWTGPTNGVGYGQLRLQGDATKRYVHRLVYETLIGPIAAGLQIDHRCRNRRCVNPAHLEAVTPTVNNRRAIAVRRRAAA